jgi:hypothetical protein
VSTKKELEGGSYESPRETQLFNIISPIGMC